jgi:hypothetical protein
MGMFKREGRLRQSLNKRRTQAAAKWTEVGMSLTFRAEVMPGRERAERTFQVARVLASGRVELIGMAGQHKETEFEPSRS